MQAETAALLGICPFFMNDLDRGGPALPIKSPFFGSMEFTLITLSPFKRRLVYVAVFEVLAVIFSTAILMGLSGSDAQDSLPVAIMVSAAAVIWNYIYNTLFESWERRNHVMNRTVVIRCFHAIGFEGGLILICLPIYMLWYSVGVWEAFVMESVLLAFFLIYTFLFTLCFDKIFTLPQHTITSASEA